MIQGFEEKRAILRSFSFNDTRDKGSPSTLLEGLWGICLILPWVYLFSLPFLHFGIWMNTEGVAFALSSLSCLGAFGLCWITLTGSFKESLRISPEAPSLGGYSREDLKAFLTIDVSFLQILFGLLALLALIMLPFSSLPELSWFGHPEGAVGIWFILSCFVFVSLLQYNQASHKKSNRASNNHAFKSAFDFSLIGASMTLAILTLFCHPYYFGKVDSPWIIYHFTAYLIGPAVCLLLIAAGSIKKTYRHFLIALSIVLILLTRSKIAYLALCLSPLLLFSGCLSPKRFLFLACLVPVLILTAIGVASTFHLCESLASRYTSLEVIYQDFLHAPWWRLLTGFGFGQMSDAILRNAPFLYQKGQQGWEGFGRFDSSAMNQAVDMFHGTGILGGVLYFLFLISPLLTRSRKFVSFPLTLAVILSLSAASCWFIMLPTFFIMFSGYAACDQKIFSFKSRFPFQRYFLQKIIAVFFFLVSLSLGYTSYGFYSTGVFFSYDFKYSLPVRLGLPKIPNDATNLITYGGPNYVHLAFWLHHYVWSDDTSLHTTLLELAEKIQRKRFSKTLEESIHLFRNKIRS